MSNMNEGAKTDPRMTMDEREQSPCMKRTSDRYVPNRGLPKTQWWEGMNCRDETDDVTHEPVGRSIADGFRMMDDNDYPD